MSSHVLEYHSDNERDHLWSTKAQGHTNQTGALLLANGLDAFVARILLIRKAQLSLDIQYYLIHDDLIGRFFIHELLQAADRGVRIRLLVDDIDLAKKDQTIAILALHPNVNIRIYNPFNRSMPRYLQMITQLGKITRRMHNKSLSADNLASIIGGRNIGDEYFAANEDVNFSDLDALVIGDIVTEISSSFDLYWNSDFAYPIGELLASLPGKEDLNVLIGRLQFFIEKNNHTDYAQSLLFSDLAKSFRKDALRFEWGGSKLFVDSPDKINNKDKQSKDLLLNQIAPSFFEADSDVLIFSPYFIPGHEGVKALADLVKKGVRVRILTNSLASNDVAIVHAAYAKYRKKLLASGVELYEMSAIRPRQLKSSVFSSSRASLHAKSFVFDSNKVFIGSFNLDSRSAYENTEIGFMIENPVLAESMVNWFDRNVEKIAYRLELKKLKTGRTKIVWHGQLEGKDQTYDHEPMTSVCQRSGSFIMGLLPAESQL